jgi:hypothetical protein
MGGRRDVQVQRFTIPGRREDRRVGECRLLLVEGFLGLNGPGKAFVLLQESVEGHALLTDARDEAAQSHQET